MYALRRLRKTLLVSFAALNLLAVPGLASAGDIEADTDTDLRKAYFDSSYTWCDAELWANAWGKSTDEAKVHIGWKLTEGSRSILDDELVQARIKGLDQNNTCYFHERNEFDYADAEQLAAMWGVGVTEAKAHISYKIGMGNSDMIRMDIEAATRAAVGDFGHDEHEGDEHEHGFIDADHYFELYVNSRYNYCDAELIGEHWKIDVMEAKTTIGYKIENGFTDMLDEALVEARGAAHARDRYCYSELFANFSEADVKLFAKGWDMDLELAKGRLDDQVAAGQLDELKAELAALKRVAK